MTEEIQKSEQPNPEEITAAVLSFNDPAIITNLFKQLGWSYSLEIQETVALAKQNANLSIKFKAIKHLRELLREAAETAGLVANVSRTTPNAQGGYTTFSAKRIAGILNPVKQIESTEIKEPQNERIEETPRTEPDRGCDRQEGQGTDTGAPISRQPENSSQGCEEGNDKSGGCGKDTREVFPVEDVGAGQAGTPEPADSTGLGSPEPGDGGTPPEQRPNLRAESSDNKIGTGPERENPGKCGGNPCVKTRPPTCDRDLYPGISTSAE